MQTELKTLQSPAVGIYAVVGPHIKNFFDFVGILNPGLMILYYCVDKQFPVPAVVIPFFLSVVPGVVLNEFLPAVPFFDGIAIVGIKHGLLGPGIFFLQNIKCCVYVIFNICSVRKEIIYYYQRNPHFCRVYASVSRYPLRLVDGYSGIACSYGKIVAQHAPEFFMFRTGTEKLFVKNLLFGHKPELITVNFFEQASEFPFPAFFNKEIKQSRFK